MQPFTPGNRFISYKYLSASNPEQLEVKMLQIQIDNENTSFTPPTFNTKSNKYEVWYLYDFSKDIKPKQKVEMNNKVSV